MITGHTRVVGIVADPVEHVRTPQMFNALMAERAIDVVMVPLHVRASGLAAFVAGMREVASLIGLVVTLPHKEAVLAHCDTHTDATRRVRAANVIRFEGPQRKAVATNTDGAGFVAGLKQQGIAVQGKSAYLAGAGGAGKAIAHALASEGLGALQIHNRTTARAEELVEHVRTAHPRLDVRVANGTPTACDLAINATSLGLKPDDPLPFSTDRLAPAAIVAEVVMKTEVTPLLAAARERGLRVHPGRHMLEGQVESIARFLGVLP